jgi:hypothetical protein
VSVTLLTGIVETRRADVPTRRSRIAGPGALLRSLRGLLRRVERFGVHWARTDDERRWAARLADGLEVLLTEALAAPGTEASLQVADQRAGVGRKAPTPAPGGRG